LVDVLIDGAQYSFSGSRGRNSSLLPLLQVDQAIARGGADKKIFMILLDTTH
jgi:hypothetical protein